MSRIQALGRDQLSEAQRELYDEILAGPRSGGGSSRGLVDDGGGLIGPFNAWLHSPELGRRLQAVGESVRFDSSLPSNVLEVGILTVGREWRAQFEWWAHARLAARAGVSDDVIDGIRAGERPEFDDPGEAVAYDFARELLETRRVGDAAYDSVVERYGTRGAMDLIAVLGYYVMVSMTLNVFRVALPPGQDPPFPED
ncbi:MAG: carboxymuconolactone decarboxylase family protein [Acidobacteriota bacterium]|nr:carboxymuconolactone decarboxylase family protein [Acidobacteriota bacterium]